MAVGADRAGIAASTGPRAAGVPTFVVPLADYADRAAWDAALADAVAAHEPDLVVSAGFMRILGPAFVDRFAGRIDQHAPRAAAVLPRRARRRDALALRREGHRLHRPPRRRRRRHRADPRPGAPSTVLPDDDEASLHERIKTVERPLLVETVGRIAATAGRSPTVKCRIP